MVSFTSRASDTIAALATPPGRSGVAVIRVSGSRVRFVIETIAGSVPQPRYAALRQLRDASGAALDEALVLFFAGPYSFTGEDCAEFHTHGSGAVIRAVLRAITASGNGVRLAEAGEFTRRAFENGKLDLTRAEGLGALIDSETEHQRIQALSVMRGALADKIGSWREGLIGALAQIEALIDFGDEGDVIDHGPMMGHGVIVDISQSLLQSLLASERGMRVRDGFSVVIAGPPNAGKSSLLNALARRDVAIVSAVPGTTRDVIEISLDIEGYLVRVSDTAGLRESIDEIEIEGMRRTRQHMDAADIVLLLQPSGEVAGDGLQPLGEVAGDAFILPVLSKSDLGSEGSGLAISTVTGDGIDMVLQHISQIIASRWGRESALVTHERQRAMLQKALAALTRATADGLPIELVAEELRSAVRALDVIIGRIDVEQVLDQVFSRFCIGK
jgi:tRNA modification GTPase